MKLFLYYAGHSFVNQIKKLFRTWVAVFLLICFAIGIVFGIGAAFISGLVEDNITDAEDPDTMLPDEDIDSTPEDEFTEEIPPETVLAITEIAVVAIALLMFTINILTAEKSGTQIFIMADVNLLFPSPLRPQSVLLFRIATQLGVMLFTSLYLIFYIPSILSELGLGLPVILAAVFCWFAILVYAKLFNLLTYVVTSTNTAFKKYIRPVVYGILLLLTAAVGITINTSVANPLDAISAIITANGTDFIPVFGWLKGLIPAIYNGEWLNAALYILLTVAFAVILSVIIFRLKADFYEDALISATEKDEKLRQVQDAAKGSIMKRKKERKEKFSEKEFSHGSGSSVFFYKAMYNRFRFAHLKIFTKTSETYLTVALLCSLFIKFVMKTESFMAVALIIAAFAFYRALGNPIEEDTERAFFHLIPESPWTKYAWSMLGGLTNCVLDLLPAFILGGILMRATPFEVLLYFMLSISTYLFSTCTGAFISLSIPTGVSQTIRSIVQVLFVYFGLAPTVFIIALGFALDLFTLFTVIATVFNFALCAFFALVTPVLLVNGRK